MLGGQCQRKVGKEQSKGVHIRVQCEGVVVQQDAYVRRAIRLDEWFQSNQSRGWRNILGTRHPGQLKSKPTWL